MNQSDIVNAAAQAAQRSKNILTRQADRQLAMIGATLAETAGELRDVGSDLRASKTIGGAAEAADWAADYVSAAATYFSAGNAERLITDAESFARERPWTLAASAAALGFVAARIVKSSSARRYAQAAYDLDYGTATGAIPAGFASPSVDPDPDFATGGVPRAGFGTTPGTV
jgi:ElaB/YqjD/DUF883 family membrane-anchored ribosome-binding protein